MGELSEKDQKKEAKMEAMLSYYDRKCFPSPETNKFISSFATKRFDVIAINNGLIGALFFSFITAICMAAIILGVTIKWNTFSTWFVIIPALLLVGVPRLSERKLEGQIFEIGRRTLRDINLD